MAQIPDIFKSAEDDASGPTLPEIKIGPPVLSRREFRSAFKVRQTLPISPRVLARVFDSAPLGIGLVDRDGKWLRVNAALCRIVDYTPEELNASDFRSLATPVGAQTPIMSASVFLETMNGHTLERQYVRNDGRPIWMLISLSAMRDADGRPRCYITQIQDISDRKATEIRLQETADELEVQRVQLVRMNHQLQELARIDPLTGIFNRRVFDERLAGWVTVAHRFERPLSLVMMDVDGFKGYNDDCGHVDGDDALRRIASQMQLCCRESDVPARYGGEEFSIVCPETDAHGATELAERVRKAVRDLPLRDRGLTVSLGVASLRMSGDAVELVRDADAALYRAKSLGRDRVCCLE